jgi:HD-GYP domain-containing protein (c-di-GMP phosphodiesterase class II)
VHDRPYKKAWGRERAMEEISAQRGYQFDPDVVDAFLHVQAHSGAETDTIRLPA